MSDAAEFIVSMIDRVSGPAHKASQAVDDLNKQLKKTGTIGVKFTGQGPVPDVIKRLNRQRLGTFAKSRIGAPIGEAIAGGVDSALSSLTHLATYGAAALGAAGVAVAGFAVKGTVHMAMFAETTRQAFGLLTGDKAIGERVFTRTIELSRQLGTDLETTAHQMQKLLAQQFSPADAEKWIKLGADLRAVGVTEPGVDRVMLDIAHVKATGKLNQRNLNQFANAGVSSQLILEEIAKAKGTNIEGVHKLMQKGQLTSDVALPAIQAAILRKTHTTEAGQAGGQFAQTTLTGLVGQLKNAPNLFFMRMADAAQGAIGKLKPLVDSIMKAIDSINGDSFVRFIETALDMTTKLVPLALEFAKGFGEGFDTIVDAMKEIDPAKASMQTAHDLGLAIADAFKLVLKTLKEVADMLIWLDQHRGIATAIGVALGATRVLGAATVGKGVMGAGSLLGKGLVATGGAMFGGAGAAAGTAATTAAAAGAGTTGAAAATAGVGTTGGAALVAGLGGAATLAAAGAAAAGIGAAAAGFIWREEIAKWMYGKRDDQTSQRGLTALDAFNSTPTPTLAGLQKQAAMPRTTTNNVQIPINVHVDGTGKDGAELGKDIAEHANDGIQQFWQSQALESGAM
jgi:tape measure domain-containing protein